MEHWGICFIKFCPPYGDETCITVYTEEQVNAVRKWAENYPIIWRVDI